MLVQWLDDCIIKSFIELFTAPPSSCLYCHSVPVFINVSNDSRLSCRCHAVGECNVIISLECQHVHICSTGSGSCRDAWWFCRCEHTTPPCLVSLAENSHGYSLLAFRWTRSKRVFEQYDYIMIIIDNMILPMWNWLHAFIWWRDMRSIAFMSTWEQFKNQIIRHTAWNQYWLIRLVCPGSPESDLRFHSYSLICMHNCCAVVFDERFNTKKKYSHTGNLWKSTLMKSEYDIGMKLRNDWMLKIDAVHRAQNIHK